jgi:Ni,Fe-hydrogenase I cytochrome b subunit
MTISSEARSVIGIILITVPGIAYGGYFLLTLLRRWSNAPASEVQIAYYRAGHAHAGVLVILAIIAQILIDLPALNDTLRAVLRAGFFLPPILIPAGFFIGAPAKDSTTPRALVVLIYIGAVILGISTLALGGLLVFGN